MYHYLFDMKSHDPRNRELVVKVEKACEEMSSNLEFTTSTERVCAYVRKINECLALMETISVIDSSGSRKTAFSNSPHGSFPFQPSFNRWGQPSQASPSGQAGRWGQGRQAPDTDANAFRARLSAHLPDLLEKLKEINIEDTEKLRAWYLYLNEKISVGLTPEKRNAFEQILDSTGFDAFQTELIDRVAISHCDELAVKEQMLKNHIENIVSLYVTLNKETFA